MRAVGGMLKAAVDPNDSVGIMDSHFPDAHFFTEFERFDRHIDKLRRSGECIDYVSICSPNYLHDAHVRFALRSDSDAICERSEEHTSELQSLMRISYAVFCLK